jgi:hypothetical protein
MSRRVSILVGLALSGVAIAVVFPFTIDDAFIPCRYAANLAAGRGFVWNAGERVEGVTGLAWTLLLADARMLGIRDLPLAGKVLGTLAALATVALATSASHRMTGGRRGTLGVSLVLATSLSFAAYAVAGLETSLFTLVVFAGSLAATRRGGERSAGLLLGAATWVRPEGLVPLVAVCLVRPRRAPRVLAFAAPVLVVLVVAKLALFGHIVPETFFARLAPAGQGRDYLVHALLPTGLLPLLVLGAFAVYSGGTRERTLGAVVLALLCAVGAVGGDWMPAWRFLVPLWPALALLAVRGALRLRLRLPRARFLGPSILGVAVVLGTLTFVAAVPEARHSASSRRHGGAALVAALRGAKRIALVDVGWVGWRTGAEIVDLGGLTDRAIARAHGTYLDKEVSEAYLERRDPDAIVLHAGARPVVRAGRLESLPGAYGVEERVVSYPFVRDAFRPSRIVRYAEGYWYVVLRRDRGRR